MQLVSPPRQHYQLVPLTAEHVDALYDLIQQQASLLAASDDVARQGGSQKLFQAIVDHQQCEAFLAVDADNRAVGAVTFYDCVTPHGMGLYLEDIVTTEALRGQGIGRLMMVGLAQIATQRGAKCVVWECADNNRGAHYFYDGLKADRCYDRHTWRRAGTLEPRLDSAFVADYRTGAGISPLNQQVPAVNLSDDHVVGVHAQHVNQRVAGTLIAYRNFSTFRTANGMHVELAEFNARDPRLAALLLEEAGVIQKQRGWTGQIDITVPDHLSDFLKPVLRSYGFEPLAYGADRMITRRLHGHALPELAASLPDVTTALQTDYPARERTLDRTGAVPLAVSSTPRP